MDFADLFPETNFVPIVKPSSTHESSVIALPPPNSFAQALEGVCDIPISQLPHMIIKRDRPSITIPEEEYLAGLSECKNNLYGLVL